MTQQIPNPDKLTQEQIDEINANNAKFWAIFDAAQATGKPAEVKKFW